MKKAILILAFVFTLFGCVDDNPVNESESFAVKTTSGYIYKEVRRHDTYYYKRFSFEKDWTQISRHEWNRMYDYDQPKPNY